MMKFILPLISFLVGNAKGLIKEPTEAITQQVLMHVRAITAILVSTIGSLALGCVGLSLFIASIAGQLDKNEDFHITGGMIVYLCMTVISAGVLAYSLRRETWMKALSVNDKKTAPSKKQSGALENAVALLVMDYIEERQNRRKENSSEAS